MHVSQKTAKLEVVLCKARFTFPSSGSSLLFKVAREQREMFLIPWLRSASILIPSPKSFPRNHAAFPDVIPKKGTDNLVWLCPALISGAVNVCTRACPHPQVLGIETQPFLLLTSGLHLKALCGSCSASVLTLLCPRALPLCLVWRLGSQNKQSTKTAHFPARLLSENIADHIHCINSAQSGSSSQIPNPN